ncbi:MAG: hypothetical protein GKR88_11400 [Flavobacteriaceae bacterium]|nr:MAG: hypothetical protein GKR88_11400 [Flavobacteriaceae bacterium]
MKLIIENRQTKTKLLILFLATFLFSLQSCAQKNVSKTQQTKKENLKAVDYSKGSNIIEFPEKLTGDEKAIFNHKYFQDLTSNETRHLDPFKVKEEFEKLGITKEQRARFVAAYTFFKTRYFGHKKSCEQWEYFKDLAPKSDN